MMTPCKIVEVRRKPIKSQRKRQFYYARRGGWTRVASPFMVKLANDPVWRRVYVNQHDPRFGYRGGTYYIKLSNSGGHRWYTFSYNDIAPFIEVCDDQSEPDQGGDRPRCDDAAARAQGEPAADRDCDAGGQQ